MSIAPIIALHSSLQASRNLHASTRRRSSSSYSSDDRAKKKAPERKAPEYVAAMMHLADKEWCDKNPQELMDMMAAADEKASSTEQRNKLVETLAANTGWCAKNAPLVSESAYAQKAMAQAMVLLVQAPEWCAENQDKLLGMAAEADIPYELRERLKPVETMRDGLSAGNPEEFLKSDLFNKDFFNAFVSLSKNSEWFDQNTVKVVDAMAQGLEEKKISAQEVHKIMFVYKKHFSEKLPEVLSSPLADKMPSDVLELTQNNPEWCHENPQQYVKLMSDSMKLDNVGSSRMRFLEPVHLKGLLADQKLAETKPLQLMAVLADNAKNLEGMEDAVAVVALKALEKNPEETLLHMLYVSHHTPLTAKKPELFFTAAQKAMQDDVDVLGFVTDKRNDAAMNAMPDASCDLLQTMMKTEKYQANSAKLVGKMMQVYRENPTNEKLSEALYDLRNAGSRTENLEMRKTMQQRLMQMQKEGGSKTGDEKLESLTKVKYLGLNPTKKILDSRKDR